MSSAADDVVQIKKSISVTKGQITATANRLDNILVLQNDEYKHKAINKIEVKDYHDRMQANFTLFKEAHSKVISLREIETADKEEEKVLFQE